MKAKTFFLLTLAAGTIGLVLFGLMLLRPKSNSANAPIDLPEAKKETLPSETFIEYTDPAGFTFSYPDNLSIEKNEVVDANTYADLQLFSKDVSGSLSLRITDSKFKSLADWLKASEIPSTNTPSEKKLGELKALEVKTNDRLMLAALDQGVLFSLEVPLIEQDFWMKVYEKVLADFTFAPPETAAAGVSNSSDEIVFEGEEVVE